MLTIEGLVTSRVGAGGIATVRVTEHWRQHPVPCATYRPDVGETAGSVCPVLFAINRGGVWWKKTI
ncbi:hypothetical protein D9V34_13970 [Mycetocola lacteus]|uniref:Uncharacterized protein n=1 Tax=Mycetocola lacteus TaxID=76637 RepID=A0A3L7AIT8_9MICO|nr:hypothetical protein D9V34_13970 [Mycetocola lacteus]